MWSSRTSSPNYLERPTERRPSRRPDPATKLDEVQAKNQAVLDGTRSGAKMSVRAATAKLLGTLKSEKDTLPFPMPEPASRPRRTRRRSSEPERSTG